MCTVTSPSVRVSRSWRGVRSQLMREVVIRHAAGGANRSDAPLAHMCIVDNTDTIAPLNIGAGEQAKNQGCDCRCILGSDSEKQNAGMRLIGAPHSELPEVAVESENQPVLADRSYDVSDVRSPLAALGCGEHVVPCVTQSTDGVERNVLVG